jgi:hypothetical protein
MDNCGIIHEAACRNYLIYHGLQEKLWKMLKDAVQSKPNIDVVNLQKSEGVVLRNSKYRQKTRSFRIKVSFIFLK